MPQVRLTLTPLQAECLLQLAEEADLDTFQDNLRRRRAGLTAIDKLADSIAHFNAKQGLTRTLISR